MKLFKRAEAPDVLENIEITELPAEGGDAALAPMPMGRLAALRARLPRFEDDTQRKTAGLLVRFMALVLVLTLVARGASGATLPRVTTTTAGSGEVIQRLSLSATVNAGASHDVKAPEGLTPAQLLVSVGQQVQPGDALARFDEDELADQLARARLALKELEAQRDSQLRQDTYNSSTLSGAQIGQGWAQRDYDATRAQGEADTAAAQGQYDAAAAELEAANNALNTLAQDADEEERAAAAQRAANAATALETARTALDSAIAQAKSNLAAAQQTLDSANNTLAGAQIDDANARRQAAETAQSDAIKAEGTALDIEKAQKLIAQLEAIQQAGGVLVSEVAGTVLETADLATASGGTLVKIADESGGYIAEGLVTKAQAEKLRNGAEAEIETASGSYYTNTVTGKLFAIGEEDANGYVPVKIQLPNGEWTQGQQLQTSITQSRQTHNTTIPVSALRADGNDYYVLVVETTTTVLGTQHRLVRVPVTLVEKDNTTAAVTATFEYGTAIVSSSSKAVQAGDTVRVGDA